MGVFPASGRMQSRTQRVHGKELVSASSGRADEIVGWGGRV